MEATIFGKKLKNVFKISRSILYENKNVFIASKNNTLIIRKVKIIWMDNKWAYIAKNLKEGERLITTQLSTPINGMPLVILK